MKIRYRSHFQYNRQSSIPHHLMVMARIRDRDGSSCRWLKEHGFFLFENVAVNPLSADICGYDRLRHAITKQAKTARLLLDEDKL
ncbi:MAG: hypothetical protein NTW75_05980 [Planctomycetales bacterium]|nr:hypothetical protein [Planctomycetales bacterium]